MGRRDICAREAAPLINLTLLARESGSGNAFSNTITVHAGDSIDYEILADLADLGVFNSSAGQTVTSYTPGTDGINSLKFNLYESSASAIAVNFAVPTLTGGFQNGIGASSGMPSPRSAGGGDDILNLRAIQSPGVFVAINGVNSHASVLVASGTANIASFGTESPSLLLLSYTLPSPINTSTTATGKINGGSPFSGSIGDADPILGTTGASVTITPEPSSLFLLAGLAPITLLARHRQYHQNR